MIFKKLKLRWKEFLAPTVIYVKALQPLIKPGSNPFKALAHITGGGFIENIPRVIPKGLQVKIVKGSWPIHQVFKDVQERSGLPDSEMYRTLNMGIGLVLVVSPKDVARVEKHLKTVYYLGSIERGNEGVRFV